MTENRTEQLAEEHARAWLHAYGIRTERYTASGGDHPAMDTLPKAMLEFAKASRTAGDAAAMREAASGSSVVLRQLSDEERAARAEALADARRREREALPLPASSPVSRTTEGDDAA